MEQKKKLVAILLAVFSWLAFGPIFKPVQFIINFLPIKIESETYYNIALVIGLSMIVLLYYLWLGLLKKNNTEC